MVRLNLLNTQGTPDSDTARQICALPEAESRLQPGKKYTLIWKGGCDGKSDQSIYKQQFHSTEPELTLFETSLFVVSIVPLRINLEEDYGKKIVWDNEKYSSRRFCRPLQFQFAKETPEKTKATVESIQTEILNLMPTPITSDITIEYNLILSMIKGKVTGVLTGTSNSNCTICQKKPSQMNEE